jgi:Ca2+-binding EF-hand superfamily protein
LSKKGGKAMNSISAVNTGYWSVQGGPAAAGLPAWKDTGTLNLQVPTSFSAYLKPDGDPPPLPDLPANNPAADSGENIDSGSKETQQTQQDSGTDSLFSFLETFDTNADGLISADELKSAVGSMVDGLIQAKDQNGDQTLSVDEAGIPQQAYTQLDTDSNGQLSAAELKTETDKIIDGFVSLLDTNGDNALSSDELAVLNLLFPGNSLSQVSSGAETTSIESTSMGNTGKTMLYGSPKVDNSDPQRVLHWTV